MRQLIFPATDDHAATYAAEAFLRRCGISFGSMQRDAPRGLLFGEYLIAKWRRLKSSERANLHGILTGRRGSPMVIRLFDSAPPDAIAAFDREAAAHAGAGVA